MPTRSAWITAQTTPYIRGCPISSNLVSRNFDVAQPDQIYAADVTYVWTQEGWLYLGVVIDLCTRKVVGWSMSSRMKATLVCDALQVAIWRHQPKTGLIHHSDHGSQYASKAFRRLLKAHGINGSMSRKGDCWDVVESFFGSLKQERVHWRNYQTRNEAQSGYIGIYYVPFRIIKYTNHGTNTSMKSTTSFTAIGPTFHMITTIPIVRR